MASDATSSPVQPEDYLLERKTKGDLKDLLKTMVAFANSVRPGHVATVLIGERNDGTPEGLTPSEVDNIQKRVRETADQIYPAIIWKSAGYLNNCKQCVRVEIEPSGDTPHFGGPAWIRRGSETVKASDAEFQRLIDIRSSMVRELDQWVGKRLTLAVLVRPFGNEPHVRLFAADLRLVNQYYVTLAYNEGVQSTPLKYLTVSWDDQHNRIKLILDQPNTPLANQEAPA